MVSSAASTVEGYLSELDPVRRATLSTLRSVAKNSLKPGFAERMSWGMLCYEVPLEVSGPTYNKKPLVYLGIASQKHGISVYLNGLYSSPEYLDEFCRRWLEVSPRLDMGKGCLRFKSLTDAQLEVISWVIAQHSVAGFLEVYEDVSATSRRKK